MTRLPYAAGTQSAAGHLVMRIAGSLERVPYWLLALPVRLAVATVFWNSAMTKLANWDAALELFRDEYRAPLLPRTWRYRSS